MAEREYGGRIEGAQLLMGSGMGATPEKIEQLQNRRAQMERLYRPKPEKPFAEVLAGSAGTLTQPEPSEKEKRWKSLPRKGPRPGLVHPSQRHVFGRGSDDDEDITLKG